MTESGTNSSPRPVQQVDGLAAVDNSYFRTFRTRLRARDGQHLKSINYRTLF
jgi:hypothetical protein